MSDPVAPAPLIRLLGLIDSQRAQGVAILYISHRLSDLQRVTNRAIVLQEGRLTSYLNTRHLPSAAYTLFGDVAEHPAITPDKALPVPFLERFTRAGFIRNRAEGRAVLEKVSEVPVHKTSSLLNDEAESS